MTTTQTVAEALELSPVESHLHPEGSFDVEDHPVPSGLEEIWRFTPLKRLRGLHGDAPFNRSTTSCTWNAPDGVRIAGVDASEEPWMRGLSGLVPNTRFAARVLAEVPSSLLIDVPADLEVGEPIVVELKGEDASNTEAGHVAMRFGAHSKAIVVLNHTGSSSVAAVVEIAVGDGADVTVVSIQDWADDAVHLAHHQALVGRDATYKHAAISFGGDVVRMDANVTYDGPGGSAELLGLYFADACPAPSISPVWIWWWGIESAWQPSVSARWRFSS
jgi:Fe-S cluster assembly protein SufD